MQIGKMEKLNLNCLNILIDNLSYEDKCELKRKLIGNYWEIGKHRGKFIISAFDLDDLILKLLSVNHKFEGLPHNNLFDESKHNFSLCNYSQCIICSWQNKGSATASEIDNYVASAIQITENNLCYICETADCEHIKNNQNIMDKKAISMEHYIKIIKYHIYKKNILITQINQLDKDFLYYKTK